MSVSPAGTLPANDAMWVVDGIVGAALSPRDRGLHYGDGVFRTVRVQAGRPLWWDEHLDKLQHDGERLALPCPTASCWNADLERLADHLDAGILKLILTRGVGQRGYRPPAAVDATRILLYDPTPPAPWPEAINLRLCDLRLGRQPRLAGTKHLNRLENVLARGEWHDPDIHEGLLRDSAGCIVGGTMSNLFLWHHGRLLTPRLDQCGVAGVTRGRLLRLAERAGIAVAECELGLDDIHAADEVMICNSVIGLKRAARLGEHRWPSPVISPRLTALLHD